MYTRKRKVWHIGFLDISNKSKELEKDIAQFKINKSKTMESINNVSIENMDEIKKMIDSLSNINTELFGKCKSWSKYMYGVK